MRLFISVLFIAALFLPHLTACSSDETLLKEKDAEIAELKAEVEDRKQKIISLAQSITRLRGVVQKKEAEVQLLKTRPATGDSVSIAQCMDEKARLNAELLQHQAYRAELSAKRDKSLAKLRDVDDELKQCRYENSQLQKRLKGE